jgi:2-aminoethylphosphonate-pyruvate transaminase
LVSWFSSRWQRDIGSRDTDFVELVAGIRSELVRIAGVSREQGYEAVLMQGSGTFGLESVISSVIPREGRFVVLANGAYGERMAAIAERLGISTRLARWPENESPDTASVQRLIEEEAAATHVAIVHCETTTGILNPIDQIARIVKAGGREFIVDAMSSFGGVPLDLSKLQIDYLISCPNKCLEGVPGFSFVLARREALEASKGRARSVSLDLVAQWEGLQRNGQFRFTPPTHALLAFARALEELREKAASALAPPATALITRHCEAECAALVSPSTCPQSGRATSSQRFVTRTIRTFDLKISIIVSVGVASSSIPAS